VDPAVTAGIIGASAAITASAITAIVTERLAARREREHRLVELRRELYTDALVLAYNAQAWIDTVTFNSIDANFIRPEGLRYPDQITARMNLVGHRQVREAWTQYSSRPVDWIGTARTSAHRWPCMRSICAATDTTRIRSGPRPYR
jgi:hypothetical protein